jgi:hypothetical protein
VSDIDIAVVDSLKCLTPNGRLEKRTLASHPRGHVYEFKRMLARIVLVDRKAPMGRRSICGSTLFGATVSFPALRPRARITREKSLRQSIECRALTRCDISFALVARSDFLRPYKGLTQRIIQKYDAPITRKLRAVAKQRAQTA